MNSFVVSSECPSCGAPLDFTEGANAITCQHCKANLLVTGRKQVLSYYVRPKLDERVSIAKATMAQRNKGYDGFSSAKSQLYFIPYYRMTGQDFGLEQPLPKPAVEEEDSGENALDFGDYRPLPDYRDATSLLDIAVDLINIFFDKTFRKKSYNDQRPLPKPEVPLKKVSSELNTEATKNGSLKKHSLYEKGDVILNDRYVEKNFLGCNLRGLGIYSLGIRPEVLRLELFRRETLKSLGKVVNPSLSIDDAERIGMKTAANSSLLNRLVIGKVLSIIYFPFWLVEMKCKEESLLTVIDAVSQSVIKTDAPRSIYEILNDEFHDEPKVIGFRPLTCPNCGWDFPVRPDDNIFFCSTCSKAWRICGSELSEVRYRMAEVQWSSRNGQMKYLPFWVFQKTLKGGQPFSFFIPVFRYRRLRFLLDIAVSISRCQPSYAIAEAGGVDLLGCYYDEEDALLLAQFTQSVLESGRIEDLRTNDPNASLTDATLTWFPFQVQGEYLLAPFGGTSIPKNLLM